jgi:hypothetical protein
MNFFWPASTNERIAYPMMAPRSTNDTEIKKNYVQLQINKLVRYCKNLTWFPNQSRQNKLHNVQVHRNITFSWLTKAQLSLYVPPRLTVRNSTFCPYSVFMCFVRISEQTAIISLYSINWPVFITETESVYCVVRAESLNIWQVCFWLWRVKHTWTVALCTTQG